MIIRYCTFSPTAKLQFPSSKVYYLTDHVLILERQNLLNVEFYVDQNR